MDIEDIIDKYFPECTLKHGNEGTWMYYYKPCDNDFTLAYYDYSPQIYWNGKYYKTPTEFERYLKLKAFL